MVYKKFKKIVAFLTLSGFLFSNTLFASPLNTSSFKNKTAEKKSTLTLRVPLASDIDLTTAYNNKKPFDPIDELFPAATEDFTYEDDIWLGKHYPAGVPVVIDRKIISYIHNKAPPGSVYEKLVYFLDNEQIQIRTVDAPDLYFTTGQGKEAVYFYRAVKKIANDKPGYAIYVTQKYYDDKLKNNTENSARFIMHFFAEMFLTSPYGKTRQELAVEKESALVNDELNVSQNEKKRLAGLSKEELLDIVYKYELRNDPDRVYIQAAYEALDAKDWSKDKIISGEHLLGFYRYMLETYQIKGDAGWLNYVEKTYSISAENWYKRIQNVHVREQVIPIISNIIKKLAADPGLIAEDNKAWFSHYKRNPSEYFFEYNDPNNTDIEVLIPQSPKKLEFFKDFAETALIIDHSNRERVGKFIKRVKEDGKDEGIEDITLNLSKEFLAAEAIIKRAEALYRERQLKGDKRAVMIGILGAGGAGKTTLSGVIKYVLAKRGQKAVYLGCDAYLHPGGNFRYEKEVILPNYRNTNLSGPGIYDDLKLRRTISHLKAGGKVIKQADAKIPGDVEREIGSEGLQFIISDGVFLGMDKGISDEIDILVGINVSNDETQRLEIKWKRDVGGSSTHEGIHMPLDFSEKVMQETSDGVNTLLMERGDFIWDKSRNTLYVKDEDGRLRDKQRKAIERLRSMPFVTRPFEQHYAWGGPENQVLLGEEINLNDPIAELWFNSTQEDGLSLIPETEVSLEDGKAAGPITLKRLTELYPEVLGFYKNKPFFVKFLCTRFSDRVHMGFNEEILKDNAKEDFIKKLHEERRLVTELKDFLMRDRASFDEFKEKYEKWVIAEADDNWEGNASLPDLTRCVTCSEEAIDDQMNKIRLNRKEIVKMFNEIKLETGQVILSPVGYPHAIFGLSHQTHPLEGPNAKNEAWIIIKAGNGLILVEPQQTSNTTYSFADFYTPIVWDKDDKAPAMRKSKKLNEKQVNQLIKQHVDDGLYTAATEQKDFEVMPKVIPGTESKWADGTDKTKGEVLVEGTRGDIWKEEYFVAERFTLKGKGSGQEASLTLKDIENTFQELIVTMGNITVRINGSNIELKTGESLFIPATIKGKYEIMTAAEDTEVLRFYKPVLGFNLNEKVKNILTKKGFENIVNDFAEGKIRMRAIDAGPEMGFDDSGAGQGKYVYSRLSKENGMTYLDISVSFRFLFDADFSYYLKEETEKLKKELEVELAKTEDKRNADKIRSLEKDKEFLEEYPAAVLAQLILSAYGDNEARKSEKGLYTSYADEKGLSDLKLFTLDNAARKNDLEYLLGLVNDSAIPEKALVPALRKCFFLHYLSTDIETRFLGSSQEKVREAAKLALKDIEAAVRKSLGEKSINKRQDIRGVGYQYIPWKREELCYEVYYRLGRGFAKFVKTSNGDKDIKLASGKDVRIHSSYLQKGLNEGILSAGGNVVDIGFEYTTTPMVSSVVYSYAELDGALQVTASHNNFTFNGIKFILGKENMSEENISKVFELAATDDLALDEPKGAYERRDYKKLYKQEVINFIKESFGNAEKPFKGKKYAVGGVSGTSGVMFVDILEELGAEVSGINVQPNGYFPYGVPNPDEEDTKKPLLDLLKNNPDIDAGVIFDSDGDRLFFAGKGGENVSNHQIICMFALKLDDSRPMVVNSRTTMAALDIRENIVKATSGYAFIKSEAGKIKASAGLEESGHFMFAPDYIDDGMRSAGRVFAIIAQEGKTIEEITKDTTYRNYKYITVNPRFPKDSGKQQLYLAIVKAFAEKEAEYFSKLKGVKRVLTIDGLLVEFENEEWKGWFQFRQSLSEPEKLYVDYEATSDMGIEAMHNSLIEAIGRNQNEFTDLKGIADFISKEMELKFMNSYQQARKNL